MLKRIISGIVGIALAVFIINFGGLPFLTAVLILTVLGLLEFYRMVSIKGKKPFKGVGVISGLILVLLTYFNNKSFVIGDIILPGLIVALFMVFSVQLIKNGTEDTIQNVAITFFGIFYVVGLISHFILLRNLKNPILPGINAIYFALICTWATDSFAYFVGKSFGRKHLAPNISPKKTVEGFIGGILGSFLAGLIYSIINGFSPFKAGVIAFLIGIVGQMGDLFESALKRDAGIKDSGNLIPGHGGVLDRFDSAFFTLPLTYYLIILFF
ncbi:hypothetical protein BBF96_02585 [Anoxybacter fermentans]|uniref:Phosphatidate cytidylyltransferase n=1 Tax=Anoxybacter fermentans TaxID=1323375 RepID=A0A3S9SVN7_9FIRM|nr:phosphatidate cytidylyltransferase [Anoxybacter fermentans]AZR72377.1 hypothetical protein BBF96_02585 [Anoxybacter fermentans]